MELPYSLQRISEVAAALGELNAKAVFIGGTTVPLYIPEVYWADVRPTLDVDVVMKILGPLQNHENEKLLRAKGFVNDMRTGAPTCRWRHCELTVDVMSSESSVSGVTNIWFAEGIESAKTASLETGQAIRHFSLPYFLGTKMEAFKSRGQKDYQGSKDLEDMVFVLEVASENFERELTDCSEKLKKYGSSRT